MASFDWRVRSAGLMAIAAIAEGTGKVNLLLPTISLVLVLTPRDSLR